jgi:eukaryotic-like serine/threonine-protein kinase
VRLFRSAITPASSGFSALAGSVLQSLDNAAFSPAAPALDTPANKPMRPQVGQLINNKYRLVRLLGDGGMGSVFEATHEVLGNSVALKFLHPELARRQGLVQRFLQEARVSAKIQSPHVVRVTDVEQTPTGLPFMVMDFLKGVSLQSLYEENYRAGKRVSFEDALNYSMQVLDGLEAAHEEGVVHRDLKPDNVMIVKGKRGESLVKLLDFGIAKLKINGELYKGLTRPGVIMGTPEYMAPEQVFSADAVDARADIFSCGVIFFEMFAGRRPVGGDEAHQIAAAYLSGNIARLKDLAPHVPDLLADAIHKAMAADPKDRFATVQDLRAAMAPHARDVVVRPAYSTPPPAVAASPAPASDPKNAFALTAKAGEGELANILENIRKSSPPAQRDSFGGNGLGVDGAMTDKVSEPWRGSGDDYAAISAKLKANQGAAPQANGDFGSTVEGVPFFPGSTEAYQPMQRPGGTDVGAAMAMNPGVPGTANYDPAQASPAPMVKSYGATPAPVRRKKSSGLGFGAILLIGTAFAAAVVGGVYAYDQSRSGSDSKDNGKTVALPQKTTSKQTATAAPPPVDTPPPMITPPPQPTTTTPVKPTNTTAGPRPTGTTTTTTSNRPPVMIPTAIPGLPPIEFPPFPGMGGQQQNPPPKSTGGKKEQGGPKLEPIPLRGANDAPAAAPSTTNQRPTTAQTPKTRTPRTEAATPTQPATTKPAAPAARPDRTAANKRPVKVRSRS